MGLEIKGIQVELWAVSVIACEKGGSHDASATWHSGTAERLSETKKAQVSAQKHMQPARAQTHMQLARAHNRMQDHVC